MSVAKQNTARQRVLRALEQAGARGCTTSELGRADVGGHRFGGRLKELRDQGIHIEGVRERSGSWRYFLRDFPPTAASPLPPEVARAQRGAVAGDPGRSHTPDRLPERSRVQAGQAGAVELDGPGESGRLFPLPSRHDTIEEAA